MATGDLQALVEAFNDDRRSSPDNDDEAKDLFERCTRLFASDSQLNALVPQEVDDALFNASFDLHHVVYRYAVPHEAAVALLDAIESLFKKYYANHEEGLSCGQFWDNALGYSTTEFMTPSGFVFLDRAIEVLGRLLTRPEAHIRASALHGLNHHPIVDKAQVEIERHLQRETDPGLRDYASQVLDAFANGKTLV